MEVGIRKRVWQRAWRYPAYLWSLRWVYAVKKREVGIRRIPAYPPPQYTTGHQQCHDVDRAHTIFYSTVSISYRFRNMASYLPKVVDFTYPVCFWRPRWGDPARMSRTYLALERQNSWAIVLRCLRYPTFSCFDTMPTCDRRTGGQTTDTGPKHIARDQSSRGKNLLKHGL